MAYMKSCLEDGTDPGVDIHSLMDAPSDATLKRKIKSKKGGEGTSNSPHPSPATQPKKYKTSIRILRSATVEAFEDQRSKVVEVRKAAEATEVAEAIEVAKVVEVVETAKVVEAKVVEAAKFVEATEISSHLIKEYEREYVEASNHHNPCKTSNTETSTMSDSVNVNTSSIIFPVTYITDPTNTLESTTLNEPETTNALETNELVNTTTN